MWGLVNGVGGDLIIDVGGVSYWWVDLVNYVGGAELLMWWS